MDKTKPNPVEKKIDVKREVPQPKNERPTFVRGTVEPTQKK